MGCDIHMFAEVKDQEGKWKKTGKVFRNPYYDPKRETIAENGGYTWNAEYQESPYNGRNYDLFAILADVRNDTGFVGVKTSEGFNPIDDPRGLPEDVSKEVLAISDSWGEDGHSHSYFTVSELKAYDWGQITMLRGYVHIEQYMKMLDENKTWPQSWCGNVGGSGVIKVSEETAKDMLKIDDSYFKPGNKTVYVNYHWAVTYRECCTHFLEKTLPDLEKLGPPDKVRIVFWFDN